MKMIDLLKRYYVGISYFLFITSIAVITAYVFDYSLFGTVKTIFSLSFILAIALYWLLFCIASVNRYIFIAFTLIWFVSLKLIHSVLIQNNVNIDKIDSIASALKSSVDETYNFFNPQYLKEAILFFFVALIVGILYFFLAKKIKTWKKISLALVACLLLTLFIPWQNTTLAKIYNNYQIAKNEIESLENLNRLKKNIINEKPLNALDNIEMIFIIPDSIRAKNLSINNYQKPTTSYMEEYEFISFPKAFSCDYQNNASILCMFTKNNQDYLNDLSSESMKIFRLSQEQSLLSFFKNADFLTVWLSSYPFSLEKENASLNSLALEADKTFFNASEKGFDTLLIPILEKTLNMPNQRKFIVLRIKGAEQPYYERYPENKEEFKPVCKKNIEACYSSEAIVNTYDNAIKEMDFFLAGIIEKLKNRNALLVLAANHGEMLGENGIYGHGKDTANSLEVRFPAFAVWISPKLEKELNIQKIVKENAQKAFDYTYLFSSLPDCVGIKSDILNNEKSFCKNNMIPSSFVEKKFMETKDKTDASLESYKLENHESYDPQTSVLNKSLSPETTEQEPNETPQTFEKTPSASINKN